jgi:hypothetical protein
MLQEEPLKGRCLRDDRRARNAAMDYGAETYRTSGKIFRKTVVLEIEKGSLTRLQEVNDWILWEGSPLPK